MGDPCPFATLEDDEGPVGQAESPDDRHREYQASSSSRLAQVHMKPW
jgi:hypothetical protein